MQHVLRAPPDDAYDRDDEEEEEHPRVKIISDRGQYHNLPLVPLNFLSQLRNPFVLDDFNDDVLDVVLSFLDAEAVCAVACTCRRLRRLCERDVIWMRLVCAKFGVRQNRTIVSSTKHRNQPTPSTSASVDGEDATTTTAEEKRFVTVKMLSWKHVYKKHKEVLFALFRGSDAGRVRTNNPVIVPNGHLLLPSV